jgi:RND family efflux transporter MFP subunit
MAGIAPGSLGGPLALVAPIDGVVLEQAAQLGQRIEASALIYRIAKLSPLWLEIQAPLAIATTLREGMPVKLTNSEVSGKLIAVGRAVDNASQTVLLRATVSKGAETLIPGQAVEVELPGAGATNGMGQRLPTSALIRHEGQTFVFVQTASDDKGSRFEARPLRVVSQGGETALAEGIKPGERIAVQGVSGLKALLTGVGKE